MTKIRQTPRPDIGARLAKARKAKGMSQRDLAAAIGLSQQLILDWEKQRKRIPSDHLITLCLTLEVSADWLLGLDRHGHSAP